jgi:hypothetical protein
VLALALLSGCAAEGTGHPVAAPTTAPAASDRPSPTTTPSADESALETPTPIVPAPTVPVPSAGVPAAAPQAPSVPATFSFRCRDAANVYGQWKDQESFPSLAAVWADPRVLACMPVQSGNTFTQNEIDAAKLSFTGGNYPGLNTDIASGVSDLNGICSRKDAGQNWALRPAPHRASDRITIQAALMICPDHPQADQLRAF